MISFKDENEFIQLDNDRILNFFKILSSSLPSHLRLPQAPLGGRILGFSDLASEPKILSLLLCQYSDLSLSSQLFSYTASPVLASLIYNLSQIGNALTDKSRLVFNRYIQLYDQGQRSHSLLFSKVILDFSEHIHSSCLQIQSILEACQYLWTDAVGVRLTQDFMSANTTQALGFKGIKEQTFLAEHLSHQYETLFSVIEFTAKNFAQFFQILSPPHSQLTQNQEYIRYCEKFTLELRNLKLRFVQNPRDFKSMEDVRSALVFQIYKLTSFIATCAQDMDSCINFSEVGEGIQYVLSRLQKNSLKYALLLSGCDLMNAQKSVDDVSLFCKKNEVDPKNILEAEFPKINSNFAKVSSDFIKSCFVEPAHQAWFSQYQQMTKSELFSKNHWLKESFEGLIKIFAPWLILTGCGLKGSPKSDIPDLRPEIPFLETPYINDPADPTSSIQKEK